MAMQRTTIVAVFHDSRRAQDAIRELQRMGFSDDQLGLLGPGTDASREAASHPDSGGAGHAGAGAIAGAATGAGVGGLWALGVATGILPALGPVIAGGVLGSLLASAATGAAIGGVAGALVGMGIPEEEAEYYEGEVKAGRTIVSVKPADRHDEAAQILRHFGAYDVQDRGATAPAPPTDAAPLTDAAPQTDAAPLRDSPELPGRTAHPISTASSHSPVRASPSLPDTAKAAAHAAPTMPVAVHTGIAETPESRGNTSGQPQRGRAVGDQPSVHPRHTQQVPIQSLELSLDREEVEARRQAEQNALPDNAPVSARKEDVAGQ